MLHEWIVIWFQWVENWGYWGVFILMAMESSIIPVPSEIVMPPAAFLASQGKMDFYGVVLAGTAGSYFGSAVSYWIAQALGLPFIRRYGKYLLFPPAKIELGERFVKDFGISGVFVARLLPVVRHLISIPAGIFRMDFFKFSGVTLLGAGIWCTVLSWFGQKILGAQPDLLQSPELMIAAIKAQLKWFVLGVVILAVLYAWVRSYQLKSKIPQTQHQT